MSEITIKSPSFTDKFYRWSVIVAGIRQKGRAKTEPEAWRLAKDAQIHINESRLKGEDI